MRRVRRDVWPRAIRVFLSLWGAVASLCLLTSICPLLASLKGQNQPEQFRRRAEADIGRYQAMLDAYRNADADGGVDQLASWPLDRVRAALARAQTVDDPFKPWDDRRYCLAAMLHTDVALSKSAAPDTGPAMAHLEVAAGMLARGTRAGHAGVRKVASLWFHAVSRYLRSREAPYAAARLLSGAREWLDAEALIFYESGTLAESLATDYALAAIGSGKWARDAEAIELAPLLNRRARHLNDASRWLRSAARLDPGDAAARLHLGRVEALRLNDQAALKWLTPLTADPDSSTAYLAAVFSAAVHERHSRLADAQAAYKLALARVPWGHSAHIGLSALLVRMGQTDAARELVMIFITTAPDKQVDPRWHYQWEAAPLAERRLDALRDEVRR